jgi:hypothetical protein
MFARPMFGDDHRPLGVVTVSARLRDPPVAARSQRRGTARDTVVSIVNADGVVSLRNLEPERWIGASVRNIGNTSASCEP